MKRSSNRALNWMEKNQSYNAKHKLKYQKQCAPLLLTVYAYLIAGDLIKHLYCFGRSYSAIAFIYCKDFVFFCLCVCVLGGGVQPKKILDSLLLRFILGCFDKC